VLTDGGNKEKAGSPQTRKAIRVGHLEVQVIFDNLPSALEQVRGGTLRGLGVTSPQRWPGVPDIPAMAETVPGFESVGFYGISAPKGTPPEIVEILNKAVGEAASCFRTQ
jgi:tripartite-type tricarboxylate transporter receptor subunit TctC